MGDGQGTGNRGGAKPKAPKLPRKAPREIKDFVACRSSSIELSPGTIDWLPIPIPIEVTFKPGAEPGSVDIEIKAPMMEPKTVPAKVTDGKLELDPANLPFGADAAGEWVRELNDWIASKDKKFGAPTLRDGKLRLVKETLAGERGAVRQGARLDPFPHVPRGEKAAAGALFAIATVAAVAMMPSDSTKTTQRPVTSTVVDVTTSARATTSTTTTTTTTTAAPDPAVVSSPAIFDACLGLEHFAGFSNIILFFTTQPQFDGEWQLILQGPAGSSTGTGPVTGGQGTIEVQIFQYGDYTAQQLMPVGGAGADIGPIAGLFPFTVGPEPQSCDPSTLDPGVVDAPAEPAPEPEPPESPPEDAGNRGVPDSGGAVEARVETVEETVEAGPPYSLLLIPGTLAFVGGGLWYDNERRRERKWQVLREAVDAAHRRGEGPDGAMRAGQR